jgi:hypothetical protein
MIKKILAATSCLVFTALFASAQTTAPAPATKPAGPAPVTKPVSALDAKVDSLIAKMTLEEKVGQMTEVTSDVVSTTTNGVHQIDSAKIKEAPY